MSLQKLSGIYPKQEKILSGPHQQYFSRYEVLTIALSCLGLFFPHLALTFLANPPLQFLPHEKSQLTLA